MGQLGWVWRSSELRFQAFVVFVSSRRTLYCRSHCAGTQVAHTRCQWALLEGVWINLAVCTCMTQVFLSPKRGFRLFSMLTACGVYTATVFQAWR